MRNVLNQFIHDEAGFIISAELILIATIAVLSLVVGLTEVASAVNQELEDVASAFGSVNQTFQFQGLSGCKGQSTGSCFTDNVDQCDSEFDIVCNSSPQPESSGGSNGGSW